ncbi:MAG: hypothetical protein AAB288_00605, partial [Acidobacteriota bacterium]
MITLSRRPLLRWFLVVLLAEGAVASAAAGRQGKPDPYDCKGCPGEAEYREAAAFFATNDKDYNA